MDYCKGGYLGINLGGANLASSGSSITVEGIYNKLEGNYGKPILLGGLVINSVEFIPLMVTCTTSGGNYILSFIGSTSSYVLTINSEDNVQLTITELNNA